MNKKWRVKRISIGTAIKVGGIVFSGMGFVLGTIAGCKIAFLSSLIDSAFSLNMFGFGFAALLFLPLLFTVICGFMGVFFSFLFALLYNIASGICGGIEVEMDEERKYDYDDIYGEL